MGRSIRLQTGVSDCVGRSENDKNRSLGLEYTSQVGVSDLGSDSPISSKGIENLAVGCVRGQVGVSDFKVGYSDQCYSCANG